MSNSDLKNKRPISPHISIYKPQISSTLSILHRISGFCLYFSALIFSWIFILISNNFLDIAILQGCKLIKFAIIVVMFVFFYHLCTGLRHMFWDMGYWFSIQAVKFSGLAALFLSLVFSIIYLIYFFN